MNNLYRTVRTSTGWLVQFTYGDDGIEPTFVEDEEAPLNYNRLMINILNANTKYVEDVQLVD